MKKKKKPATPQPLPKVYQAVLALRDEFQAYQHRELHRTVQRALNALEKASAADRRPQRLEQARVAIVDCYTLCHIRYLDRVIDARRTERAIRRVAQIRAGLALLEEATDEQWSTVPVPKLAPQPLHPHRTRDVAMLDEIKEENRRPPPPQKPPRLLN